eukprot:Rmarinus@m.4073
MSYLFSFPVSGCSCFHCRKQELLDEMKFEQSLLKSLDDTHLSGHCIYRRYWKMCDALSHEFRDSFLANFLNKEIRTEVYDLFSEREDIPEVLRQGRRFYSSWRTWSHQRMVLDRRRKAEAPPPALRVACLSDTHGLHRKMLNQNAIPTCDILIHAGDFTRTGTLKEIMDFVMWFKGLRRARYKVLIAGNHDLTLHTEFYESKHREFHLRKEDSTACRNYLRGQHAKDNFFYLEDDSVLIEGLKIYGTPWQPKFRDWAFNLEEKELREKWDMIPDDTDILLTHAPPRGYGDDINKDPTLPPRHVGCPLLLEAVNRIQPRFHVFGHIHEGYGVSMNSDTCFINASTCTFDYRTRSSTFIFECSPRAVPGYQDLTKDLVQDQMRSVQNYEAERLSQHTFYVTASSKV